MRARTHSLTFTRTHTHTRANELPGLHCWFSQDKLKRLVNGHQPSAGGSGVSRGSRVGGRTVGSSGGGRPASLDPPPSARIPAGVQAGETMLLSALHLKSKASTLLELPKRLWGLHSDRDLPTEVRCAPVALVTASVVHFLADTCAGVVLGAVAWKHAPAMVTTADRFTAMLSDNTLRRMIVWLNSFPGGFKLNVPLSRCLSHVILFLVKDLAFFAKVLHHEATRVVMIRVVAVLGLSGVAGVTGMAALTYDLVRGMTWNIVIVHTVFRSLLRLELKLLWSLLQLFRVSHTLKLLTLKLL